ncbi:colicin uptake protein TolR [Candidatus Curculioniphilus buchneri]|uniref:colicin uptake protein TolR n=1 Tax=Candidatus Curculioniphilus buchneri TaxID=690594 RepID=UPI00376F2C78
MIRKRARREIKSEINIIPLLDVLLVLVLICMATAPILSQSVEVDLPNSANSKIITNDNYQSVIIEVSRLGQYSLIINNQRQEYLPAEKILTEISTHITKDPKTVFLIGGAKDAPYNEIIKALNLLRQAGIQSVGLITQPI